MPARPCKVAVAPHQIVMLDLDEAHHREHFELVAKALRATAAVMLLSPPRRIMLNGGGGGGASDVPAWYETGWAYSADGSTHIQRTAGESRMDDSS